MLQGAGKIEVYSKSKMGIAALLYNFDIGLWALKPEHIRWLTDNIKPFAGSSTLKTTVIGFASRSGGSEANKSLSIIRAHTTEQVIWQMGGPPLGKNPYPVRMAFGEDAAALTGDPDAYENERWRSVFVVVTEPGKAPDIPKPNFRPPKLRRLMVTFTVEMTVGGALSGGGEPGDHAARNSERLAGQMYGLGEGKSYSGLVPADATLSEIRATQTRNTVGMSNVGIPGVLDTSVVNLQIEYVYTVGGKARPTFEGEVLDTDDLDDWMSNPSKKYLSHHLIGL